MQRWKFLLCALALGVSGCDDDEPCGCEKDSGLDAAPYLLDAEAIELSDAFVRVELDAEITSVQPLTGLAFWPDRASDLDRTHREAIALEFSYCLPSDIVLGREGSAIQYDWGKFEALLDEISGRNHQAVIRFRYEYPGGKDVSGPEGSTAVPAYIKNRDDYSESFAEDPNEDGATFYADWSNAELQWFTKQFYSDFAERYGDDPRIAFLEVGFGHWSEYHIYGTPLSLGQNFPSKIYQRDFLLHLSAVMPIPWAISIDAADSDYSPITEDEALFKLGFGLFDDSFMHSEHDLSQGEGYNEQCFIDLGGDSRWQRAPFGGEISYYEDEDDQHGFLNPKGLHGVTWAEASAKYHLSFMIANDAPDGPYGDAANIKNASRQLGYRLTVTDLKTDGKETYVKVRNTGIAPLYRDAYFKLGSERSGDSLALLLPGQERWIRLKGDASVEKLGIESPHILKTQRIEFEVKPEP